MSAAAEQATVPARQELLQEQLQSSSLVKRKAATVDAMEDIVFGSLAGIAGKFIEYPFDTVKVRLQSQPDHLPLRYTGPLECFRQSIRADGILGLYRGISAPLVGAALDVGSLFFFERVAQRGLFAAGLYKPEDKLPLSALFFTGAVAGAFTSLVLTPIELVKCRIQVPTVSLTDGTINRAPKPIEIIRQIYRHGGLLGFWHGQFGTLIRETGGSAAWFGGKQTVTEMFRHVNKSKSDPSDALEPLPLWQQAIAGAAAGVSYNFSTYPADTIKSRMQCASPNSASQTFCQEGIALWKQHGLRGMYRGCGITLVRSAPSSAFIFILYDAMKREFHFA